MIAALVIAPVLAAGALYIGQQEPKTLSAAPVDLAVPNLGPEQLGQWCVDRKAKGTDGLSDRSRRWLNDCIAVFGGGLSATPQPDPSPTSPDSTAPGTTPSPTTSPSSPSGTTTTNPPTSGPSTTLPAGTTGCMAQPSKCGFPDATNTGTTGPLTVVSGDVTLTTPGMVYSGKDVRGCISVRAKNVVIRNVRVTCPNWYAIGVNTGTSGNIWSAADANLLIEDTEINLAGSWEIKGIGFDGYTARRVHFYGGSDCAHMGRNVTVVDSFCDIPTGGPADGPHYDGFQSDGGSNITLKHNTIRVPYGQTSAILMSTNTSPISNVSIVDNLVAGGGYTVYCGTSSGGPVQGSLTFSGNRVARTYFTKGGYWGPTTSCPKGGAVWDDTGVAI